MRDREQETKAMQQTLRRGMFASPARAVGATGAAASSRAGGDSLRDMRDKLAGDNPGGPYEAGRTVRRVAGRALDVGQDIGKAIADPVVTGVRNRAAQQVAGAKVAGEFARGLAGMEPSQQSSIPRPQQTGSRSSLPRPPPASGGSIPRPANPVDGYVDQATGGGYRLGDPVAQAPQRLKMPENDDPIAANYVKSYGAPRSEDLNAKNTRAVPGLDGVAYAGRYGETDVFRGTGANGEAAFSDLANLATTRGGAAADLPRPGQPGYGNETITNNDVATNGIRFDQAGSTPPELIAARQAAEARGDWDALRRSYMSSGERAQEDAMKQEEKLRRQAYRKDPAAAYGVDQQSLATMRQSLLDQEKDAYQRSRDQQTQSNSDRDYQRRLNKDVADMVAKLEQAMYFKGSETPEEKRRIAQQMLQGEADLLEGQSFGDEENPYSQASRIPQN